MSTDPFQEIVTHLRAIRAAIAALRDEVHEIRLHQEEISQAIAALRQRDSAAGDANSVNTPLPSLEARLESLCDEVERIKRRLVPRAL